MKALVFNGPSDVRYETYKDPILSTDNSVILKVNQCSICGSDLHIYHGDQISSLNYSESQESFCVGHEFTGEVVEVGKDVHRFKVGDYALSIGAAGCGVCTSCRTGNMLECTGLNVFGVGSQLHGGQAEYVCVPTADQSLHAIPEGITDEQALLMTDAMVTAATGLLRTDLEPGDSIAVVGLGPIGLIAVELALALGASQVFAIDPISQRREHAKRLGAFVYSPADALERTLALTQGRGVKRVLEASGATSATELALVLTAQFGTTSFIGLPQAGAALDLSQILYKHITIRAGLADPMAMWPKLVPLLQQGKLKAEGLFSHKMNLSEGAEAYRKFDARNDGVIKILLEV